MNVADRAEAVARAFEKGLLKVMVAAAATVFAFGATASAPGYLFDDAYTADPAPLVSGGRMYLYTGHDDDYADRLKMSDWLCYSTADMTNWVSHGTVAGSTNFAWGVESRAWAAHCVERGGRFYFYASTRTKDWKGAIGVMVSDSPTGPFKDAIGRPLLARGGGDIDPAVFVDTDGAVYLYWGLGELYIARLNDDMISLDRNFGKDGILEPGRPRYYHTAPWVWKRGDTYYMASSARKIPVGISLATASAPEGPWTFRKWLIPADVRSPSQQVGIASFLGKDWLFGYNYQRYADKTPPPRRHCERRSVWVKEFSYDGKGLPEEVRWWED